MITEARSIRRSKARKSMTTPSDLLYKIFKHGAIIYTCDDRHDALKFIHDNHKKGFKDAMENGWGLTFNDVVYHGTDGVRTERFARK